MLNFRIATVRRLRLPADTIQALALARIAQPDIFLLDAVSSAADCVTFLAAFRAVGPRTKVLLIHADLERACVIDAVEAGAKGCLSNNSSAEDCIKAIRAVNGGDLWLGRRDAALVLEHLLHKLHASSPCKEALTDCLSGREHEIATLIGNGLSNKEIAYQLGISNLTVKTHLKNIFHKLKISRRDQIGAPSIPARKH